MHISVIRRKNIELLISKHHVNGNEFAKMIGVSKSMLSQIRSTKDVKPIGNNLARSLEAKLNMPEFWLDIIHDDTLTPEDIAEKSLTEAGFKVTECPSGVITVNWERWAKPDFTVVHDAYPDLKVFVDIHPKFTRLGVPLFPDNNKTFVYIEYNKAKNAGQILLEHFKRWSNFSDSSEDHSLNFESEHVHNDKIKFVSNALKFMTMEQMNAFYALAQTIMKANNIDAGTWGHNGDTENEKSGKKESSDEIE